MKERMRQDNPWKGLQSYQENDIIYGRDEEIGQLYIRILYNIQTVVYGKSGIGKSSIINAGIIPRAKLDEMLPVSIRLAHTTKKEQTATVPYVQQIKTRIEEELQKIGGVMEEIVPHQEGHRETLWELMHRHRLWVGEGDMRKPITPLLLFDQFEEIFTLEVSPQRVEAFFSELADLLNEIKPEYLTNQALVNLEKDKTVGLEDGPLPKSRNVFSKIAPKQRDASPEYVEKSEFHVVITLREDFLSYLERYTNYIPSMKQNRFALLPLNEEQAAKIITEPIKGLINESVATEIIQRVTGRADFSLDGIPEIEVDAALLSLYMEQLYKRKGDSDEVITSEMVLQYSDDIIKNFYEESIRDIPEETIEYIENELITNANRRNNVARSDLIIGGVDEDALDQLINKKVLRQFSYGGDLRIELIHDILCPIVNERIEHREQIAREKEEQRLKEEETRQLLLIEERKRQEIERKAAAERQRLEEEALKQRRKNKARFTTVLFLLVIGIMSWGTWFLLARKEFKESYASFTVKNGWPVGLGKQLGNQDKKQLPLYYQLVRNGLFNLPTRVNVLNSEKTLTQNCLQESPLVRLHEIECNDERAIMFAKLQCQTAYWIYTPDLEGHVSRKTAYNKDGVELYAIQFFTSSNQTDGVEASRQVSGKQLWATYIDKDGKSLRVRDNGADRMRITVNDTTGYYEGFLFFNEIGVPQPNVDGVYGYRYKVGNHGEIIECAPLDAFGDVIHGASVAYKSFDEYGRWITALNGEAEYNKDLIVYKVNNRIDSLRFSPQGELQYRSELVTDSTLRCYSYKGNQLVEESHFDVENDGASLRYNRQILPQSTSQVTLTRIFCADSIKFPYLLIQEEKDELHSSTRYYCGKIPSQINEPFYIEAHDASFAYHYHEIDTETIPLEDGIKKVITEYKDARGNLSDLCEINRDVAFYNDNNEMEKHIQYRNETIIASYLNDYENGRIVAQYVMDEDSMPIRYPQWDINHYCYYKMKLVYDFSSTPIAIKGVNEFGEESLITKDQKAYLYKPEPSLQMKEYKDHELTYGKKWYKIYSEPLDNTKKVEYIHILRKEGTWYKAGIRNGDLLVNEGEVIKIARPNVAKNTYDVLSFVPGKGQCEAEHYPVFFTETEMNRYNNAINQK